jgi:hypothetical protein
LHEHGDAQDVAFFESQVVPTQAGGVGVGDGPGSGPWALIRPGPAGDAPEDRRSRAADRFGSRMVEDSLK